LGSPSPAHYVTLFGCKRLPNDGVIEMDDPRCKTLFYRVAFEMEDPRCQRVTVGVPLGLSPTPSLRKAQIQHS
jgi:hypothetical protein